MITYKDENFEPMEAPQTRYKSLKELRDETNKQTRLLYHLGYWDGPLSGVMLWQGEKVYFNCVNEFTEIIPWSQEEINEWVEYCKANNKEENIDTDYEDYDMIRQYAAYRLDKETMDAIDFNHERFRTYVGTHTDYDEDGNRGRGATIPVSGEPKDLGDLKPYNLHGEFYNKPNELKKTDLRLSEREIVGYFER